MCPRIENVQSLEVSLDPSDFLSEVSSCACDRSEQSLLGLFQSLAQQNMAIFIVDVRARVE